MDILKETLKEIGGWLLVILMFAFILGIVFTGGGLLSPEYWQIVFAK